MTDDGGRGPCARLAGRAVAWRCSSSSRSAVVAPPERCPSVSAGELRRSAQAAVDWFVRNQDADGTWLYLYDADEDSIAVRVQRGPPRRGDDGPLPGRRGGAAGRAALRRPGHRMGARQAPRARRLGRARVAGPRSPPARPRSWSPGWPSAARPPATRATTTCCAGSAASCSPRPSRRARCSRHTTRRAGRRCPASTPSTTPARPTGRWRACTGPSRDEGWGEAADRIGAYLATSRDEVEDHWPPIPDHWAAYGMAETVGFPERGRPPLTDARGGLRAPAGRAVRRPGPLGRASGSGPWGALVRGRYAPRGGGYGVIGEALTGLVADRAGGPAAGRPARPDRRARDLHRRAGRERAVGRRRTPRTRARPEPGGGRLVPRRRDPHGRPAARAGRAAADHPDRRGGRGSSAGGSPTRRRRALGLAVGRRAAARAEPGPRRVRGASRRAVAARASSAWPPPAALIGGARGVRGRGRWEARCSTRSTSASPRSASPPGSWPRWPAPPTCSGDRPRPSRRSPAGARRSIPVAIPLVARPALLVLALGAGADAGRPGERRRDGGGRRAVRSRWPPAGPPRARAAASCAGPAGCWPPRSSPAGSSSPSTGCWPSSPALPGLEGEQHDGGRHRARQRVDDEEELVQASRRDERRQRGERLGASPRRRGSPRRARPRSSRRSRWRCSPMSATWSRGRPAAGTAALKAAFCSPKKSPKMNTASIDGHRHDAHLQVAQRRAAREQPARGHARSDDQQQPRELGRADRRAPRGRPRASARSRAPARGGRRAPPSRARARSRAARAGERSRSSRRRWRSQRRSRPPSAPPTAVRSAPSRGRPAAAGTPECPPRAARRRAPAPRRARRCPSRSTPAQQSGSPPNRRRPCTNPGVGKP